jgi:hypothetical protein
MNEVDESTELFSLGVDPVVIRSICNKEELAELAESIKQVMIRYYRLAYKPEPDQEELILST